MFNDISVSDYTIDFELQKAYFLRDCLYEEISYELKDRNIIIYKKLDNGISEEISLDELIFYIHTDVAEHLKPFRRGSSGCAETQFYHLFKDIVSIKKAVENMKIILKYDNDTSDDDSDEEKDNNYISDDDSDEEKIEYDLLTDHQLNTLSRFPANKELFKQIQRNREGDEGDKVNEDNVTLAF